jgi:hypothetical protein
VRVVPMVIAPCVSHARTHMQRELWRAALVVLTDTLHAVRTDARCHTGCRGGLGPGRGCVTGGG